GGDWRPRRRRIVMDDGLSVGETARRGSHGLRRCQDDVDGRCISGLAAHDSYHSARGTDRIYCGNYRDVSPRWPEPANDAAVWNLSGNRIGSFLVVWCAHHRVVRLAVSLIKCTPAVF